MQSRIAERLVFMGTLAFLGGCAARSARPAAYASEFRIPDAELNRGPRPVSGGEAARDLDVAARDFAEAYAGLDGRAPVPA
ncbi:MAG TPA: hypothetical protein VHB21_17235, partial [Minicystis sp.]|nr:hypothetical protein [Minicystis sp.]